MIAGLIFSPEDADLYGVKWRLSSYGYAIRHVYRPHRTTEAAQLVVSERAFGRRADRYGKGEVTDHINRNKLDNRRENLRIVPIAVNNVNRDFNSPAGEAQWNSKLTAKAVAKIRARYASGGVTLAELGKEYSCHFGTISDAILFKTWKHVKPLQEVAT